MKEAAGLGFPLRSVEPGDYHAVSTAQNKV